MLAALASALALAAPAGATAALPPLNVAVSTSNATTAGGNLPFVQGNVYALTYIFTDTANAKLTDVQFRDQLPAGVTVAPGTTASALNCGSFTPASQAGASVINADGFTVYGNSPNHCAMEFFVTASTVEGPSADTPGPVRFSDNGTLEPSSDVVFPSWSVSVTTPPSMAITFPANGAHFAFDQKVRAQLHATPGPSDAIAPASLYAVDEVGDEVANGGLIPTDVPGPHTLTLWTQTVDGYIGSGERISYSVGSPAPSDITSNARGDLRFKIRYLQTGTVTATLRYGHTVIARRRRWVHVGYRMPVWIAPNARGRRILAANRHGITVSLSLSYRQWVIHSFTSTPTVVFGHIHLR